MSSDMVGPNVKITKRRKQGGTKRNNNSCALAEMELGGRTVVEALVQSLMIVEAKVIGADLDIGHFETAGELVCCELHARSVLKIIGRPAWSACWSAAKQKYPSSVLESCQVNT